MGHLNEEINQESEGMIGEVPPMARKVLDPFFEEKNLELYRFLDKYPGPPMEQRPFPHFAIEPDFTQIKQPGRTGTMESKQEVLKVRTQTLLPNILLIGAQLAGTERVSD